MIELVLVVCLHALPDRCEERSIGLYPEISVMTCMMQAQPQIAVWSERNPQLKVARFTCRDSTTRVTKA